MPELDLLLPHDLAELGNIVDRNSFDLAYRRLVGSRSNAATMRNPWAANPL